MDSNLNPDAPEFSPQAIQIFIAGGHASIQKTVRYSRSTPIGQSRTAYEKKTNYNHITNQLSSAIFQYLNKLLLFELQGDKISSDLEKYNELIVATNDNILDRVSHHIDNMSRRNSDKVIPRPAEAVFRGETYYIYPQAREAQIARWIPAENRNERKPQISYKYTTDNSTKLWEPIINYKPNSLKPLGLEPVYDKEGHIIDYKHPYEYELSQFQPRQDWLDPDTNKPQFPPDLNETTLTFITTEAELDKFVEHLETVDIIGVDLEHDSYRSYQGITCLIQITTVKGDFIIDALAVREHVHKLNTFFTNPNKLKIFHGADMDIIWLQRDFGVYVVGLFDTHQAARILNLGSRSLSALLMRYCSLEANKCYQLADWRTRPLTEEMIKYARTDTHYLLYIWRIMKMELLNLVRGEPYMLISAFDNSRRVCCRTYKKPVVDETSLEKLCRLHQKNFNDSQMSTLRVLYQWRDNNARMLDESARFVMPDWMMLRLIEQLPRDLKGVRAICQPMRRFVRQNIQRILEMLLSCRQLMAESLHLNPYCDNNEQYLQSRGNRKQHDIAKPNYWSQEAMNAHPLLPTNEVGAPTVFVLLYDPDNYTFMITSSIVNTRLVISPYDRHRYYRLLIQGDDNKECKDKGDKMEPISKGNELIKMEVPSKLQEAMAQGENEGTSIGTSNEINTQRVYSYSQRIFYRRRTSNPTEQNNEPSTSGTAGVGQSNAQREEREASDAPAQSRVRKPCKKLPKQKN